MIFPKAVIDQDSKIDFYAGNDRSYKDLLPLYNALGERRGVFFASPFVHQNGIELVRINNNLHGESPLVISNYKDLNDIFIAADDRPFIMYEKEHSMETRGLLKTVSLFLCKDSKTMSLRKTISKDVVNFQYEEQAAKAILDYCKGIEVKHITTVNGKSVGIVYMAWGDKALKSVKKSMSTLRWLGYSYPVAVVCDAEQQNNINGYTLLNCNTNPFDKSKACNFQFRAGRVKPQVCHLSPFDYNLYIDADTQFIKPIQSAFEMLKDYDLIVTEEKLSLLDLYNKKLAGWELNMIERDETIKELGNGSQRFINSGVMFFRRNDKTLKLFADWYTEWMRFQEWDEQLALMRAIHKNKNVKVNKLGVDWNSPHLTDNSIIFHNYGRGEVRQNA